MLASLSHRPRPLCTQIFDACTETDVLLPSYVVFEDTSGPISTLRLATFTGTRFFRSIFTQLEASAPLTTAPASHPPPRHRARKPASRSNHPRSCFRVSDWGNKMRLDGVSAETLDLLLRLMEGKAPARMTLRQAGEVFGALDYCLVQNLSAVIVYYLGPMITVLYPKEVLPPPSLCPLSSHCFPSLPLCKLNRRIACAATGPLLSLPGLLCSAAAGSATGSATGSAVADVLAGVP